MTNFIIVSSISAVMILATCLVIYEIFRAVWAILPRLTTIVRLRIVLVIIPVFAAHILNIWLYATAYFAIENFTTIGLVMGHAAIGFNAPTFLDCLYFSSATYTTLGFGDIIPTRDIRMLTATEALNGLVLMGWSVSYTYLVMEDFWKLPVKGRTDDA